jgi:gliding motility-associated-like protein
MTTAAEVVAAFNPVVHRAHGNLCENGEVKLEVLGSPTPDVQLSWQIKKPQEATFTDLAGDEPTITAINHGAYQVTASNETCTRTSTALIVDDELLVSITPEANENKICSDEEFTFTVNGHHTDNIYEWYFSGEENTHGILISNANFLSTNTSGYYHAVIKRGICSATTDIKHLSVHPADSIFIPNVFTPNGDGINDKFEAWTTSDDVQINVLNRYGQGIFRFDNSSGWTGDGFPSGTYYWQANYSTCLGERKILKGYVQLLR